MRTFTILLLLFALFVLCRAQDDMDDDMDDDIGDDIGEDTSNEMAEEQSEELGEAQQQCYTRPTLTCFLIPTISEVAPGVPSNVRGILSLSPFWSDDQCFTRMAGYVSNLGDDTPHGVHIHELGDISAPDGTSTGGHYNPFNNSHGLPNEGARSSLHVGDLGNLFPNATGVAQFDTLYSDPIDTWALVGRSVVVHAGIDNGRDAQPTGGSGARVAVCVIGRLQA